MIVGGYTLDLYCDAPDCSNRATGFYGNLKGEAMSQARKSGWTFNTELRECYCKNHKKGK